MKKNDELATIKTVGRKRDSSLDSSIIEATIEILAEVGFEKMTMDMVAAKAETGKASMYRRWSSKPELVRDALIFMSQSSVELNELPDTGTLRGDLLALLKPYAQEHSQRKFRVLRGLGSFFSDHRQLAEEAMSGIFDPMTEVNMTLMKRAKERGEISKKGDIAKACEVIVAMIIYYSQSLNKPFDKAAYSDLLDGVILPALKK